MKNFLYYLLVLILLVCSCNTSQDDYNINNPSELIPHIELIRISDPYNQIIQTTIVSLTNNEGDSVELSGIYAEIDNQSLEVTNDQWGYSYFTITNNESLFEPGSNHTLSITLQDGKSYICQVTFPNTKLTKLLLTSQHSIKEDLIIQWEGIDKTPKLLTWSGLNSSQLYNGQIIIPEERLNKGSFLLGKEYLSNPSLTTFSLVTSSYGTIDPEFSEGEIMATWVVQADCLIYE